eukprot:CCRYP_010291-RA/>CCRYP_010291-RA protein AED:0.35 eAED:0.38 QI:0/0/0/1/0/0/2/0/85
MFTELLYHNPPQNLPHIRALATCNTCHVIGATTLCSMPRVFAFSRNMLLNVQLIVDWQAIAKCCKQVVNDNLCCANRKCMIMRKV